MNILEIYVIGAQLYEPIFKCGIFLWPEEEESSCQGKLLGR